MDVKELIGRLRCFDENHHVRIEAVYDSGCGMAGNNVDDVQFKGGDVVIRSEEW